MQTPADREALCEGCCRSLNEIAAWGGLSEAQKTQVWAQIRQRARPDQWQQLQALSPLKD